MKRLPVPVRAAKIDGASLIIEVNASDEGKLFGSVGTREIADALNAQAGSDVSKAEVLMPHEACELGIPSSRSIWARCGCTDHRQRGGSPVGSRIR